MIDTFSLALAHGLLALTAWRLFRRPDLDRDDAVDAPKAAWGRAGAGPRPPETRTDA